MKTPRPLRALGVLRPVARGLVPRLLALGALSLVVAVAEVAFVGQVGRLPDLGSLLRLETAALVLVALLLVRTVGGLAAQAITTRSQEALAGELREHHLRRILAASPFSPLPVPRGELPDTVLSDSGEAVALPLGAVSTLCREPVRLVGFLAVLAGGGWPLLAFLLSLALLSGLLARRVGGLLSRAVWRCWSADLEATACFREGVERQASWLVAGGSGRLLQAFGERRRDALRASLGSARVTALAQLATRLAHYAAVLGGTWIAGRLAGSELTVTELASFGVAAAWLQAPVSAVAGLRESFLRSAPALGRLSELDRAPCLDPGAGEARELAALREGIVVEDVSYAYPGGRTALAGATLAWPVGSALGIAGPSGSGKSTLVRLLARLARPDRGTIRLDGVDLQHLPAGSLRSLLGVALQPPELVRGTLRENLALARPAASDAEVAAVVAALDLDGLVAGLPEGLETRLGEAGEQVSEGQRVRIGIARVLVAGRPLAVFDEPTAALDEATAEAVVEALRAFARGRTVCVVSHDPRALRFCDRVVRLRGGSLVSP